MTDKIVKFDGEEANVLLRCVTPVDGGDCIKIDADQDNMLIAVRIPKVGDPVIVLDGDLEDVVIVNRASINPCTITSGGFETGVLTPWVEGDSYNTSGSITVSATAKRSGNYGLLNHLHIEPGIESYSCYNNVYQELGDECSWGEGDQLSFWYNWHYVDYPSLPGYYWMNAYIEYYDPDDELWHVLGATGDISYGYVGTWRQELFTLPAPVEGRNHRVRIRNFLHRAYAYPPGYYFGPTNSTVYLDDFSLIIAG